MGEAVFLAGTYTRLPATAPASAGIYRLFLDTVTGALRLEPAIRHDRNPSWLGLDRARGLLWAADELGATAGGGGVSAWRLPDASGRVAAPEQLGTWTAAGDDPCHLALSADGACLAAACYSSGSLCLYRLGAEGLPEGEPTVQDFGKGAHAHMAMPLPAGSGLDGDFLVPDLGSDTVWLVDRMGAKRAAWRGRTGDGPRHLAPLPGGGWLLLNELSGDAARLRPSGGTPEETARLALADHPALGTPSGAAIKLLPGTDRPGNCLALASLRGAYDAIVALRATGDGLALAARSPLPASGPLACRGPRDFAFAPGGLVLVAGQRDHAIASFRLDPASGALAATGHAVACPSPVCLLALA